MLKNTYPLEEFTAVPAPDKFEERAPINYRPEHRQEVCSHHVSTRLLSPNVVTSFQQGCFAAWATQSHSPIYALHHVDGHIAAAAISYCDLMNVS